jgi:hypothetical protein
METYRHSGVISPLGIVTASATGIVVAIVLGVAYSFAIVNIPFVKINFILTFFFGAIMGLAVGWGAKLGKIRNTFVAAAYGFIVGLVGLYIAWGTDCLARFIIPEKVPVAYLTAYSPNVLWAYIKVFYESGAWALKGGENVSGLFLATIWGLEALIIVGFSTFLAGAAIADQPFCENCKRWAVGKLVNRNLSLDGAGEALKQLLSGDLASLMKFNLARNESDYLQLELKQCPTCTTCNCLTISKATESVDKKGETSIAKTPLVRNMLIAAEFVPLVENAGREPSPKAVNEEPPGNSPQQNGDDAQVP